MFLYRIKLDPCLRIQVRLEELQLGIRLVGSNPVVNMEVSE